MPSAAHIAWAKFRVLFTAVAAIVILAVLVYLLSGGGFFQRKVTIRTYLADSTGIGKDAPVRLNGVLVGKVGEVRLSGGSDPRNVVEVLMLVRPQFLPDIPDDSQTDVSAETLIGDKFINITKGQSRRQVEPGGVLARQPESDIVSRIDLPSFEAKLRDIDVLLADIEAGRGPLGDLIKTDDFYQKLLGDLTAVQSDAKAAASTTAAAGRLLYGLDLYQGIERPLRRLDQELARLQQGQGPAGAFLQDPAAYDRLRSTIADVRRSAADLGQSPFLVTDQSYALWNKKVAGLIGAVDDFNAGQGAAGQLLINTQIYESLTGSAREIQRVLREFRTHPRKFLRIDLDIF